MKPTDPVSEFFVVSNCEDYRPLTGPPVKKTGPASDSARTPSFTSRKVETKTCPGATMVQSVGQAENE